MKNLKRISPGKLLVDTVKIVAMWANSLIF
jgi:hypothetical protein